MEAGFQKIVVCEAKTVEAMRREMFRSAPAADLLEVRLDSLLPSERDQLDGCFHAPPKPTVATARRAEDGGGWVEQEPDRIAALESAAKAGADWIDLEWGTEALRLLDRSQGAGRIVSLHMLQRYPEDPGRLAESLVSSGGDAVKLAVRCHRARQVLELSEIGRDLERRGVRASVIPLGVRNTWGRLWAPAWGSWAGYFGPPRERCDKHRDYPLGGLPIDVALDRFRIDEIGPSTRMFAVIGEGVRHSLSPPLHMAALREAGLDGLYVPVELEQEDLRDLLLHPNAFPFEGLSVTTPFKEGACSYVSRLEGAAAEAGALNTVRRESDGTTTGFNTDGIAVRELVECHLPLSGAKAVVLGAGGAARGVAQALVQAGSHVTVLNRGERRARTVADDLGCDWGRLPDDQSCIRCTDLLVNATPLGDDHGPGGKGVNPISEAVLSEGAGVVVDLVYRPQQTRLLREASRAGWTVIDGTEVLVRQAAYQFQIWTGRQADLEAMRSAL